MTFSLATKLLVSFHIRFKDLRSLFCFGELWAQFINDFKEQRTIQWYHQNQISIRLWSNLQQTLLSRFQMTLRLLILSILTKQSILIVLLILVSYFHSCRFYHYFSHHNTVQLDYCDEPHKPRKTFIEVISKVQKVHHQVSIDINVGDECWRQNVLVTSLRCWGPI